MAMNRTVWGRRRFLEGSAFLTAAFTTAGLYAEELLGTPAQTEGPFYPDKLPLDTDNDLLTLNDTITPAVGEVTHLAGRVLSTSGQPVRNAVVEIWQADSSGAYLHSGSMNGDKRDRHFQGFGRFLTDSKGQYYFRTIKPVPYPGRTPHIHFAINRSGRRILTTQCYIKGDPRNDNDGVLRGIRDPKLRDLVMVNFVPQAETAVKEYAAEFNIVVGLTPTDAPRES
ncbi:MAG: protocatechuate 3,4-dioxygenase [Pirellulaceae bacterium]